MPKGLYKITKRKRQGISLLLVFALVFLTIFPYHYHLQHHEDVVAGDVTVVSHEHEVVYHGVVGDLDSDHLIDSHQIDVTNESILKFSKHQLFTAMLVLTFLVVLPACVRMIRRYHAPVDEHAAHFLWFCTPPFRAPPAC